MLVGNFEPRSPLTRVPLRTVKSLACNFPFDLIVTLFYLCLSHNPFPWPQVCVTLPWWWEKKIVDETSRIDNAYADETQTAWAGQTTNSYKTWQHPHRRSVRAMGETFRAVSPKAASGRDGWKGDQRLPEPSVTEKHDTASAQNQALRHRISLSWSPKKRYRRL